MQFLRTLTVLLIAVIIVQCGVALAKDRTVEVKFAAGADSTTIKNTVVSGTRDRYSLKVKAGQHLDVNIASDDNNASFTVYAPNQTPLTAYNARNYDGPLVTAGVYRIDVGVDHDSAAYQLTLRLPK